MQENNTQTSVYLRKVGTFAHINLRGRLNAERIQRYNKRISINEDESPLEFD